MFKKQMYHSQFELFPVSQESTSKVNRSGWSFKGLTLSMENIIVMAIIFVMNGVMFFSLGIENGKRMFKVADVAVAPPLTEAPVDLVIPSPPITEPEAGERKTPPVVTNNQYSQYDPKAQTVAVSEPENKDLYTIQVASFKSDDFAQKEAGALKQKGYESSVHRKGNYSIVCVGNFIRLQAAKEFSNKLKPKYKDCLVRRL